MTLYFYSNIQADDYFFLAGADIFTARPSASIHGGSFTSNPQQFAEFILNTDAKSKSI